jgi:hypothetical protein
MMESIISDTNIIRISRTVSKDQVVDELVISFTHDIEGRLLSQYMPAGFENFFAEVGIPLENVETFSAPSMDTIDITKIVTIAHEKYGLNVIMPEDSR